MKKGDVGVWKFLFIALLVFFLVQREPTGYVTGERIVFSDEFSSKTLEGSWQLSNIILGAYESAPGTIHTPPPTNPMYSLVLVPGQLRVTVPSNKAYDFWYNVENALLLTVSPPPGDLALETKATISHTAGPYHTGLVVYFGPSDAFLWGFAESQNRLYWGKVGPGGGPVAYTDPTAGFTSSIFLRIEKRGERYTFLYKSPQDNQWITAGTMDHGGSPQKIGLITKTWGSGTAVTTDFDYFTVTALPSIAVPAPVWGPPPYGGSGGTAFSYQCPAGKAATGIRGRAGNYLDQIQFVCDGSEGSAFGGSGGNSFSYDCPSGSFIVGIRGKAGNYVDQFGVICEGSVSSPAYGGSGGNEFRYACPDGVVRGIFGRSGLYIDQISVQCDAKPAAAAGSDVYGKKPLDWVLLRTSCSDVGAEITAVKNSWGGWMQAPDVLAGYPREETFVPKKLSANTAWPFVDNTYCLLKASRYSNTQTFDYYLGKESWCMRTYENGVAKGEVCCPRKFNERDYSEEWEAKKCCIVNGKQTQPLPCNPPTLATPTSTTAPTSTTPTQTQQEQVKISQAFCSANPEKITFSNRIYKKVYGGSFSVLGYTAPNQAFFQAIGTTTDQSLKVNVFPKGSNSRYFSLIVKGVDNPIEQEGYLLVGCRYYEPRGFMDVGMDGMIFISEDLLPVEKQVPQTKTIPQQQIPLPTEIPKLVQKEPLPQRQEAQEIPQQPVQTIPSQPPQEPKEEIPPEPMQEEEIEIPDLEEREEQPRERTPEDEHPKKTMLDSLLHTIKKLFYSVFGA